MGIGHADIAPPLPIFYRVRRIASEERMMIQITVELDQDVYAAAHRRAKKLGASLEGLVRGYLRSVAEGEVGEPRFEEVKRRSDRSDEWDKMVAESTATLRPRDLDEVISDFERRGVGLDMSENQTREEMYDEARKRPDAFC